MRIGVLALQGAFLEHEQMLHRLGVETFEIRQASDWETCQMPFASFGKSHQRGGRIDGLIIPGGESTTMVKLLRDFQIFDSIRGAIAAGLPVFGTCAGLILLGNERLATMDITVRRNAYGRQLGSFFTLQPFKGIEGNVPMTFIRAPYIEQVGERVEILAEVDGHIVAARQQNQLATAFHPELSDDTRVHEYFLRMAEQAHSQAICDNR
ncbi:MAG: pyridoxal 5'-phosphate synthase glutaminase subunit PdxT [Prevotella sp.]|nr:pyridoxal 5'-phosphate synthase glutaminase subunit PdxT [Prevotella sp.]